MKKSRTYFVALLLAVFVLVGCMESEVATAVPPTATAESISPTAEPTAEPTDTPIEEPTPTAEPESMMETLMLDIKGFLFRPETVTVEVGTAVTWNNLDDIQHTVTSGVPDNPSGTFDSGFFVQNEQFTYTFEEPGEYPYYCQRHPHMQGTIVVE